MLPEALEKWSTKLIDHLLPRHLELIYLVNHLFIEDLKRREPHNGELWQRMSIIEDYPEKSVRMAQLLLVCSHAVNGVA